MGAAPRSPEHDVRRWFCLNLVFIFIGQQEFAHTRRSVFIFILFIVNATFPVGLLLYWVTTNLWTVGQGIVTRRMFPRPQPPPKRSSRTPPKATTEPTTGDGAAAGKAVQPSRGAGTGQQRVRRRKKKGPRSRR